VIDIHHAVKYFHLKVSNTCSSVANDSEHQHMHDVSPLRLSNLGPRTFLFSFPIYKQCACIDFDVWSLDIWHSVHYSCCNCARSYSRMPANEETFRYTDVTYSSSVPDALIVAALATGAPLFASNAMHASGMNKRFCTRIAFWEIFASTRSNPINNRSQSNRGSKWYVEISRSPLCPSKTKRHRHACNPTN